MMYITILCVSILTVLFYLIMGAVYTQIKFLFCYMNHDYNNENFTLLFWPLVIIVDTICLLKKTIKGSFKAIKALVKNFKTEITKFVYWAIQSIKEA